jgi:hypothetical protein
MANAVGVNLRAQPLRDDIDVVVLKVFGNARDKGRAYGKAEQHAHAAEELVGGVLAISGGVVVDDMPEDDRIEKRKDLVDRRQAEDQRDHFPVTAEVRI